MSPQVLAPLLRAKILSYGLQVPNSEGFAKALIGFIAQGNTRETAALTKEQRIALCKKYEALVHTQVMYKGKRYKVTFVGPRIPAIYAGPQDPEKLGSFVARISPNDKGNHSILAPVQLLLPVAA